MNPRRTSGMIWTGSGGPPPAPVCAHAVLTLRPCPAGPRRPGREAALGERAANLAHQLEIEMEVVEGGELRPQHLAGQNQMPERAAAEVAAGVARAPVLDRARVT